MGKAKVAAWRVRPETIHEDIQRLFELAGLEQALAAGVPTLLQRDITSHHPLPAANTTPWQLDGSIRALRSSGFTALSVAPSEDTTIDAVRADAENHYRPVLERHGLRSAVASGSGEPGLLEYRPRARLHVLHEIFPAGIFLPERFFGRNLVHLPTMKSDLEGGIAGALKCGLSLLGRRQPAVRACLQRALVDLLAIQREINPGRFALMDGTTAGNGRGSHGLIPIVKDVMLASADLVALDTVAAKLMGLDPSSIGAIRLAHEDGLGVGDVREIELAGADISGENWHFSLTEPRAGSSRAWRRPLRPIQDLLLRGPAARAFALGSEFYHERYLWQRQDRRTFERWQAETRWGRLFASYGGASGRRRFSAAPGAYLKAYRRAR
jgi:uncharacterized protein (DUF362 family)